MKRLALVLAVVPSLACPQPEQEQFSAGLEAGYDEVGDELDSDTGDAACGNGMVEAGEQCDQGEANAASGQCTPDCQINVCGDGYASSEYEECDDGNAVANDACLNDCKLNVCGDGVVNAGVEVCDDGNQDPLDGCNNQCMAGTCGNGDLDEGELCDDGNTDTSDACPACLPATCGDGYAWAGSEECDDANTDDSDACLANCVAASCGDGLVWADMETCDDGNLDDDDACPSSCEPASCGDGFVWAGMETCDDGNHVDEDGCDATCFAESCVAVTNGPDEDIVGDDWFDLCPASPGTLVIVKLADAQGNIVYQSQGMMVGDWTVDQVTSTGSSTIEYNENSHDRLVALDNGDKLFVAGKDADPGMDNYSCNTTLGDGYVIIIYPSNPNWYLNPKMIVTSYDGAHTNQPRPFVNWGPQYEIAWNNGSTINPCTIGPGGLVAFEGTFTMRVKNP